MRFRRPEREKRPRRKVPRSVVAVIVTVVVLGLLTAAGVTGHLMGWTLGLEYLKAIWGWPTVALILGVLFRRHVARILARLSSFEVGPAKAQLAPELPIIQESARQLREDVEADAAEEEVQQSEDGSASQPQGEQQLQPRPQPAPPTGTGTPSPNGAHPAPPSEQDTDTPPLPPPVDSSRIDPGRGADPRADRGADQPVPPPPVDSSRIHPGPGAERSGRPPLPGMSRPEPGILRLSELYADALLDPTGAVLRAWNILEEETNAALLTREAAQTTGRIQPATVRRAVHRGLLPANFENLYLELRTIRNRVVHGGPEGTRRLTTLEAHQFVSSAVDMVKALHSVALAQWERSNAVARKKAMDQAAAQEAEEQKPASAPPAPRPPGDDEQQRDPSQQG